MYFKKVLFAVDDSEYSRKGIPMAAVLSEAGQIPVTLLHVIMPIPSLVGGSAREELQKQLYRAANEILDEFKNGLEKAGVPASVLLAQGDAADEILAAAKAQAADIVVMGAKGHGSLGGFLLGSVSQKVLHYSDVPVLIAR